MTEFQKEEIIEEERDYRGRKRLFISSTNPLETKFYFNAISILTSCVDTCYAKLQKFPVCLHIYGFTVLRDEEGSSLYEIVNPDVFNICHNEMTKVFRLKDSYNIVSGYFFYIYCFYAHRLSSERIFAKSESVSDVNGDESRQRRHVLPGKRALSFLWNVESRVMRSSD